MAQQNSASTSTTATLNSGACYDVFINHRGADVKKTFASHLYSRLLRHGLRVFLEKEVLEEGNCNLSPGIERVIRSASVQVAIFSPRYAESPWCLNELVLMLNSGSTIIPVFYHVKPADLRWTRDEEGWLAQTLRNFPWDTRGKDGVYAKALCNLERKMTYDAQSQRKKARFEPSTVEKWREALSSAASISGLELEACNWDEGMLVDMVVKQVEKTVRNTLFPAATYLTGLDGLLQEFDSTVLQTQEAPGKAKVVGIVGLSGIGKTTLAKEIFNRYSSDYDRSSFLFHVRDASLIDLQEKLAKDLISRDLKIDNIADGLSRHLRDIRALIILDDVDHVEQLNALSSPMRAVHPDSLIVLITVHQNILSGLKDSSVYKMRGLNPEHSRELLCWHAFHQPFPVVGFEEMVGAFLSQCKGLPLSLKVFGELLQGNDLGYWKDLFHKISNELPTDIRNRLKISYGSLDLEEKQIFLDIACFFLGKERDTAIRILDGSGWEGSLGIVNLQNKCLIEIDNANRIRMHDHLRDLGRDLANNEPPGSLRRLCLPLGDLPHNVPPGSSVRGMSISEQISGQSVGFNNCSVDMSGLQLLSVEGDCLESISSIVKQSHLTWLRWERCPYPCLPPWIPLRNLRVLEVNGCKLERLWKDTSEVPLELRELNIGTLSRFPRSIGRLKYLEKIELEDIISELPEEFFDLHSLKHWKLSTRMKSFPDSLGNLTNLRHIDLSHSVDLQMLPHSFGNLTELQHLNMNGCSSLERLPDSFGNLSGLKYLCLAGCSGLILSGGTLGHMSALENLDISLCRKIEELPPQVTHQRFLQEMNLSMTMLKELPNDFGNLVKLEVLKLDCPLLEGLPPSLGNLTRLRELSFVGCRELKCLPGSVAMLKNLKMLTMDNAGIQYLPEGILGLNNLESLSVKSCPLLELPFFSVEDVVVRRCLRNDKGMLRLKDLDLHGTRIKKLSFPRGLCPHLHHLNISGCLELVEVGALPATLISLNLNGCTALKKITGLCGLAKLRRLDIQECCQLEESPGLQMLASLEESQASG